MLRLPARRLVRPIVSILALALALVFADQAGAAWTPPPPDADPLSAGGAHTCAIRADAQLACWGDDSAHQVSDTPGGRFLSVSAGDAHSCAIRVDAQLACWGDDSEGQVSGVPEGEFLSVSAGGAHSCAIGVDGHLACWGDDSKGQVSGAPEGEFLSVSAGGAHTCAIRSDHALACWGDDSSGQSSSGPEAFHLHKHHNDRHHHHNRHHHHDKDDPPAFLSVSAGGAHTCAIALDEEVVCWGDDSEGQVSGSPEGKFLSVSAGSDHSCALNEDRRLTCWGDDSEGQVSGTPESEIFSASAGGAHTCGMEVDHRVTCWGDNSRGQALPQIVSPQPARAMVGVPYEHLFQTTPQMPPAAFSVSGGELPPGLQLDEGGQLGGEPTSAGDYSFAVTAANGMTEDAVQEATLEVVGTPVLTIGTAGEITTSSARLAGTIDPRNLPAQAWFEYWPAASPNDVTSTAMQEVPSGLTPRDISAHVGGLAAGTSYEFRLAATNELGAEPARSETASFATTQPPVVTIVDLGLPPPTAGQSVNVEPVDGVVGTDCGGGGFTRLQGDGAQIPVGCRVDTRHGTVALTASKGSSGETQTAYFWGGVFGVTQKAGDNQDAVLTLAGRLKCEKRKPGTVSRVLKRGRRGAGRRLWGSGKGNYKTVGNYGSASVRGTTWLVVDRCDNSTLMKVAEGTVRVRDFVKNSTVILETGEQYLAKAAIPRLR